MEVPGQKILMVLNIEKDGIGYKSTLDIPTQGAKGLPVTATTFKNSKLTIKLTNLGAEYIGELNSDGKIVGDFSQGGGSFPLTLSRGGIAPPKRPQEPRSPYPYYSEDVKFDYPTAKITLAGTLTLPKKDGVFPVVVLITGSGPQNRNEELLGHKPFLVLSDYLTRNGIGVLRFDARRGDRLGVDHLLDDRINISHRLRRSTDAQRRRQQGEKQHFCERILKHYLHLYPNFLNDRGI